jgi:Zn-dependent peptidase ImmA (M78 family)/transcriptional regulator with XRE-family HTH domain
MEIGQRIKTARTALGLSLSDLKERTGIGESSLSEFETGKREPKISQLNKVAKACSRPFSYFFVDRESAHANVLWRLRPDNHVEVELKFVEMCRTYSDLEKWCDDVVVPCLPTVTEIDPNYGSQDAADLAKRVRGELGLGSRPSLTLLNALIEDCGIRVFHDDFEPTGAAASIKSPEVGFGILLNARNVRCRRNFDLAHELFHLLVWDAFRSQSITPTKREESLADTFAAHLLMPEEEVRSVVGKRMTGGKLPIEAVQEAARQFDVSSDAMAWRIHFVFNLGAGHLERTQEAVRKLSEWEGHSKYADEVHPPKYPERYRALAVSALRKGEVSTGRFAEILEIDLWDAMQMDREDVPSADLSLAAA